MAKRTPPCAPRAPLAAATRRFLRDDRGAVTVEFMILFPVILFFLFFIIAVSFYIATASDVQQAAQSLARAAIGVANGPEPVGDICTRLGQEVLAEVIEHSPLLDPAKAALPASCASQPNDSGMLTITLTYDLLGSSLQAIGNTAGFSFTQIMRSASVQL